MNAGWGFRFGRGPLRFWIYWKLKFWVFGLGAAVFVLLWLWKSVGGLG